MTHRPAPGRRLLATAALLALATPAAEADEGMWTFEHPPLEQVRARYGVALGADWLAALRGSAVSYGASASFVSERGLLLTNHHVAIDCLDKLSSRQRDLVTHGFVARRAADELRCPGDSAQVLVSTEDVTAAVTAAEAAGGAGAGSDEDHNARRKAAIAAQEAGCKQATGLHCEVVSLYSGAVFHLYRYQQWDDIRLVFAPEYQAAFFGGDPDNFVFPRFALDAALFRVYDKAGRPVRPAHHLKLASQPVAEGDLVFVAGHPGRTERLLTLAQLQALRTVDLPMRIASAQAQQALLQAYSKRSPEAARQALNRLFGTENWLKAMRGEFEALRDPAVMARKAEEETRFRADHARLGLPGDPWAPIEAATQRRVARAAETWAVGYGYRTVFQMAGQLVELAYERQLPEGQRLRAYRPSAIDELERDLKADVPVYKDLEIARMAGQVREAQRLLPPDHPFLGLLDAGKDAEATAERLVRPSRLDAAAVRAQLLAGGVAAIETSDDPLIRLARQVYPLRRALTRFQEEQVDTPIQQAAQALGQARFAIHGHGVPPDATGTLRLGYGRVAGYTSHGQATPWKTTWGGWFARADGFDGKVPFDLPPKIAASRRTVDPRTPLNFVSTVDIIGGNSGSPLVNQRGEWVGLIFDGNLESLGSAYVYTDDRARALSVHAQAVVAAVERVYGAPALAQELRRGR